MRRYRQCTMLLLIGLAPLLWPQGRLRPPQNLPCDRDRLTSYSGKPAIYARSKTGLKVTIDTEENTRETVRLDLKKGESLADHFRWEGEPFRNEDWARLEASEGKLREGIRLTAWVCSGGATPVLDWRAPQR